MKDVVLTIVEEDWERLNRWLLQADGKERQCFLDMGLNKAGEGLELLVHRVLPIPDEDYSLQTRYFVKPKENAVLSAYASFSSSGTLVHGHVHSHPFSQDASFSSVDVKCRRSAVRGLSDLVHLQGLHGETMFFQWVMGLNPSGSEGILCNLKGEEAGRLKGIRVVGRKGIKHFGKMKGLDPAFLAGDERLERNIRWLGVKGQERLQETHLAICGAGGVGALLAANVKGLGFGEITIIDPDRVEESNLNRLDGAGIADIEAFKVDVLKREIRRVRPETKVNALPLGVEDPEAQEVLQGADLIVGALDGMSPRLELQVLAARFLKPLFDLGSGISVAGDGSIKRMGSQIITYLPGGPCLACQGMDIFRPTSGLSADIRKRTGYVAGSDFTPTSVVTINSVVAGWAVDQILKYLTGLKEIPLFTSIDQWNGQIEVLSFEKKSPCGLCGDSGIEGKGESPAVLLACHDFGEDLTIEAFTKDCEAPSESCPHEPKFQRQRDDLSMKTQNK